MLGISVAALGAGATPAMASSTSAPPVTVSLTSNGGSRTLSLWQPDGTTPLTTTDLSSGTSNFIAQVKDATYSNTDFTVQATMSNLYTSNCSSMIPSSAISLTSPTNLLTVAGVSANLTPVFNVAGTLTSTQVPELLTSTLPVSSTVSGELPTGQTPLSQSQITSGSTLANLVGPTASGLGTDLPVNLANTIGTPQAFQTADAQPTCDPGVVGSPVQIMSGTADPTGLLGPLESLISSTVGTVGSNGPTLSQLVAAGYLTNSQVSTMLQGITGLTSLVGVNLTGDLSSIESTLTASLTTVTSATGSLVQTGSYSSSPSLSVDASKIPGAGSYTGLMTVTLVSQ